MTHKKDNVKQCWLLYKIHFHPKAALIFFCTKPQIFNLIDLYVAEKGLGWKQCVKAHSFSYEAWVETNQKNATQQGEECRVGQLYSRPPQPVSVGSCSTELNSQVLPSIPYSRVRWFTPDLQWLNGKM
jgi:hypothetical protein